MTNIMREHYLRDLYRARLEKYAVFRFLKRVFSIIFWPVLSRIKYVLNIHHIRDFYILHLKKYKIIRVIKEMVFGVIHLIRVNYFRLVRNIRSRKYKLQILDCNNARAITCDCVFAPEQKIVIRGPRFIGEYPIELNYAAEVEIKSPEITISRVNNAVVVGRTSFILSNGSAFHPELYSPARDVCAIEHFKLANVNLVQNTIEFNLSFKNKKIRRAATLVNQSAGNYVHFLTEILPKLPILDSLSEYDDLPIIVDGWVSSIYTNALKLFNINNRDIILLDMWSRMTVESLVDISPTAYSPTERRQFVESDELPVTCPEEFNFSKSSLSMLRAVASDLFAIANTKRDKRLYIRRKAIFSPPVQYNLRSIVNSAYIENLVLDYGFEIVEPEKLSIEDQIKLFCQAGIVISPVGAALANLIFSPPGTKVIALAAYYKNPDYYFFSNLMGLLEHQLYYVLGPQVSKDGHPLHRDYRIDENALREAMELLCK